MSENGRADMQRAPLNSVFVKEGPIQYTGKHIDVAWAVTDLTEKNISISLEREK